MEKIAVCRLFRCFSVPHSLLTHYSFLVIPPSAPRGKGGTTDHNAGTVRVNPSLTASAHRFAHASSLMVVIIRPFSDLSSKIFNLHDFFFIAYCIVYMLYISFPFSYCFTLLVIFNEKRCDLKKIWRIS